MFADDDLDPITDRAMDIIKGDDIAPVEHSIVTAVIELRNESFHKEDIFDYS